MDERTLHLPAIEPVSTTHPARKRPLMFGGGGMDTRIKVITDESLNDHEVTIRGSSFDVGRVGVEPDNTIVVPYQGWHGSGDGGTPLEVNARVPSGTSVGMIMPNRAGIELTGDFDYLFAHTRGSIAVAGSLHSGLVDCDGHLRVEKITGSLTAETRGTINVGSITGSASLSARSIVVDHVRPAPGHNVSMVATSGDVTYRPDPRADRDRIHAESAGGTVIDLSARGQRTADARNTSSHRVAPAQHDRQPAVRGDESRVR